MKNISLLSLTLFTSFFTGCSIQTVDYPAELQQLHQNMIDNILENPAGFDNVEKYLTDLSRSGQWPDIDYTSKERGGWTPADHLSRILTITKAYYTHRSGYYHKTVVSEKIHSALNYWLENDFQCPNWWYPEIGVPRLLAPIMLLMEAELSTVQKELGIKILDRSKIGMTGQNKVWQSGNVLMKSLLLRDVETIRKAVESIQEELVVSQGEGVQPDWSYHQHGPQLQFGNYGLAYVGDMIKWISILRNTPFKFDETKVSILRNYLLEGQQWVTWKNQMDISACGRQLFPNSPGGKASSLSGFFKKMAEIDPEFADEYIKADRFENLSGNKHFWRSDIQVQRTPEYYFSVKMCSERVIGAESCNAENIQGYYMGDGATFLYQSGEEYLNIFPYWDWKKIPGTTTMQDNETLPVLTAKGYRVESGFVGGISDGKNGIAVMDYNRNGLQAKKSWFMFNDMFICLGADIKSLKVLPVTTSVNQSLLNGNAIIKTGNEEKTVGEVEMLVDPKWILHDNIGYFFPEGGMLNLDNKPVEGSWHHVFSRHPDEKLKTGIFKLWFDHGINPSDKSYAYIIVPNANTSILNDMETQLPFMISNKKHMQEVISSDGSYAGIVFYKSAMSDAFGGVEVNEPCVVMLKKQNGVLGITVADPTQLLKDVQIAVDGEYQHENASIKNGKTIVNIVFPKNAEAGKSVNIVLKMQNPV